MATVCDLCKLLANPFRLEMLRRVHASPDGLNVGVLVSDLDRAGIGQSGVSQYLKQLASIGVIRRVRAGRYVNYIASKSPCRAVQVATEAIVSRLQTEGDADFVRYLPVLMNPFRAKVVAAVAKAGRIPALEICEKLEHNPKYLKRDLQEAVDAGLLITDDSAVTLAEYGYAEPSDPVARLLISLLQ